MVYGLQSVYSYKEKTDVYFSWLRPCSNKNGDVRAINIKVEIDFPTDSSDTYLIVAKRTYKVLKFGTSGLKVR